MIATRITKRPLRGLGLALGLALATASVAQAADVTVMISGAFLGAYKQLIPGFENASGDHVITINGPSTGADPGAITNRLGRGENADVLIVTRVVLDDMAAKGLATAVSETDLSRSGLGFAVKAGAAKPDIGTVEAFKATLLAAQSVVYPDTVVGAYVSGDMYKKLGISDQMAAKSHAIKDGQAGLAVANGQAQYAIQQTSELKPVAGIDIVGYVPEAVGRSTVFSAGIASTSKQPDEAKKLIAYLASPEANAIIIANGAQPMNGGKGK